MAGEIFISYRRSDEAWARLLHSRLAAEGVDAWYDAQIGAGQDWRSATAGALQASRIFVLLFSAAANQSEDIAKELAAAIYSKKLVVPVRIENIEPTGAFLYELASRNWVNAFDNTEARLADLAKSLAALVKSGDADESVIPFDRAPAGKTRASWRGPVLGVLAAIAVTAIAAGAFWWHSKPAAPPRPENSRVAVLPFEALAGKDTTNTFAKTVAEQIVATLNDVQVQTVSREDAQTLKGPDRDTAAAKLGAEFILNGSVQEGEKGLRVTMHVDHVPTHATLWTASYDQGIAGVAEFQSQIAAVASDIAKAAVKARKEDPDEIDDAALGLILKIGAGGHTITPTNFLTEAGMSRQLIARAPKYGRAWSDLAMDNALLTASASADELPGLRAEANRAAAQALALNPRDGGAYLALAVLIPNGRWAQKEAAFRKGISAAPEHATLQNYLAGMLAAVGRQQDALVLNRTAVALDPQSPPKNISLAVMLAETGHATEGIAVVDRAAKIWPSNATIWQGRFYILSNFGHADEARAMLDAGKDIPVSIEPGAIAAWRAWLEALRLGSPGARTAAANAIRAAMTAHDIAAAQAMMMFAKIGEIDTAFDIAQTLIAPKTGRQGPTGTTALFQAPTDSMRRDVRFMPLAAKAGLVDYWKVTGKWPDFCSQSLPYDCRAAAGALHP